MNAFRLSGPEKLALWAAMPGLLAEEVIRDRGSKLTPESLRELMLLATGDVDQADQAYCDRVLAIEREKDGTA